MIQAVNFSTGSTKTQNISQLNGKNNLSPNFKGNLRLSYRDVIELISALKFHEQGLNTGIGHGTKQVCRQLTDLEKITPHVVKRCNEQLRKIHPVFEEISARIESFITKEKPKSDLPDDFFAKLKNMLVDKFGKNNPKISMHHVNVSPEELMKEASLKQAAEIAELARYYTKTGRMMPQGAKLYWALHSGEKYPLATKVLS